MGMKIIKEDLEEETRKSKRKKKRRRMKRKEAQGEEEEEEGREEEGCEKQRVRGKLSSLYRLSPLALSSPQHKFTFHAFSALLIGSSAR